MKIGEFSKKYQVSQPTVRYYAELGLLIPEIKNKQYVFTPGCEYDLQLILRLKSAGFSLSEIHEILSLRRISNFASEDDIHKYMMYLEKRNMHLLVEKKRVGKALDHVKALMDAVEGGEGTYENS